MHFCLYPARVDYLRKIGADLDGNFLRESVQLPWTVRPGQMLIEMEAEDQVGAAKYERSPNRKAHRNGYRERMWETRVGEIPLSIPKLREGTIFPSLLEPRKRSEQALGLTGIDKSKVSRICNELVGLVEGFRTILAQGSRRVEGEYPYLPALAVQGGRMCAI